jgi:hypothetical protein
MGNLVNNIAAFYKKNSMPWCTIEKEDKTWMDENTLCIFISMGLEFLVPAASWAFCPCPAW